MHFFVGLVTWDQGVGAWITGDMYYALLGISEKIPEEFINEVK